LSLFLVDDRGPHVDWGFVTKADTTAQD
jgi:hypothetical protein